MHRVAAFSQDTAFAKPDLYYGAAPETTVLRRVGGDLHGQIMPFNGTHSSAVLNFFHEAERNGQRADVAKKQTYHTEAVCARAIHGLQNYGADEAIHGGNAHWFLTTCYDGVLRLCTTHITAPKAAKIKAEYLVFAAAPTPKPNKEALRPIIKVVDDKYL